MAVERHHVRDVGGARRQRLDQARHEGGLVRHAEGVVGLALLAHGGHGAAAEGAAAAERAAHVGRPHLDVVAERRDVAQGGEQVAGARPRPPRPGPAAPRRPPAGSRPSGSPPGAATGRGRSRPGSCARAGAPGWRARSAPVRPTRRVSPCRSTRCGSPAPEPAGRWIRAPVAAARRPRPETWSAWTWVSTTWAIRKPWYSARRRYSSMSQRGSTTTASSPHEITYDAQARSSFSTWRNSMASSSSGGLMVAIKHEAHRWWRACQAGRPPARSSWVAPTASRRRVPSSATP